MFECSSLNGRSYKSIIQSLDILFAHGPTQGMTNCRGGECHPFSQCRSHPEKTNDTGIPPSMYEIGFKRTTLVLRDACLTHLATAASVSPS